MSDELSVFVEDEPLEVVITPDGCNVMIGDALGITWRGAYAAGATYNVQDAVQYSGDSYISLVNANTGHTPDSSPTYWSLMVEGGSGGGAELSDADPQPLGTPSAGTSDEASRADHVHGMPSAADVGAAAASHAHVAADVTDLGGAAVLDVGTTAGTVAAGDDARLSDARTPTAHAASHATLGGDPIAAADIGAAPASHGHVIGDLSSGAATVGQVATADGAGGTAFQDAAGGSADPQSGALAFGLLAYVGGW